MADVSAAEMAVRVEGVRKFIHALEGVRTEYRRMTPQVLKAAEAMNKFAEAHEKELPNGERG